MTPPIVLGDRDMRGLLILFATLALIGFPVSAQEWPDEAKRAMDGAGSRLASATTTAQRVDALRQIEAIAAAYPDAPDARIAAYLIGQQATMEAGPGAMLDALGTLAASGDVSDPRVYGEILLPIMQTLGDMQDDNTLLPSAAIALDDAISGLDKAAARAGLPGIADAIDAATGLPKLGSDATNVLSRLAAVAKLAQEERDLATMDAEATKAFIDNIVSIGPPIPALGVNQIGYEMFRDTLAWNNEMYGQSAKALNLVADAIETGQLDSAAYQEVTDNLNRLSSGPWDSSIAKGVLQSMCEAIPILGSWCGDAFKFAEELISGANCEALTCDCQNVGGGLMRGPLIVQCELHQSDLINQCLADNTVSLACLADAKGPGASH